MKSSRLFNRVPLLLAGAFFILALALLAGCGSSSSSDSSSTSSGTASTSSAAPPAGTAPGKTTEDGVVNTSSGSDLGPILVDSTGRTLYLFEADKQGGPSTCEGACASAWPPFVVKSGKPTAGPGATASMLTTTKRSDGSTQVSYNGWPLYYYVGDSAPGDTTGNDITQFDAQWYALTPAGVKASD